MIWCREEVTLGHFFSLQLKYELDFTHKEFYQLHISYHLNTIWSGLVGLLVVLAVLVFITYKTCISCRSVYENVRGNACAVFKNQVCEMHSFSNFYVGEESKLLLMEVITC